MRRRGQFVDAAEVLHDERPVLVLDELRVPGVHVRVVENEPVRERAPDAEREGFHAEPLPHGTRTRVQDLHDHRHVINPR